LSFPTPPRLALLGVLVLSLSVLGTVVTHPDLVEPSAGAVTVPAEAVPAEAVPGGRGPAEAAAPPRTARPESARRTLTRRPDTARDQWSGFAFDACRAPSQRVMDRWLRASPFLGVGIYLGGIHRACPQRHLTAGWVARQTRAGWRLLPLWVGPQASCTGYRWRIDGRPGPHRSHPRARRDGVREARAAVRAARRLGIATGSTLWYDLEPFPMDDDRCRRASLTFLDAWTRTLHGVGFRSGVYSHVAAGVSLLSRAPARYAAPDRVWYAFVDHRATDDIPRRFVRSRSWMRARKVHQFALDKRVRFGGVAMDIDWNWVSLGRDPVRGRGAPCGIPADSTRHPQLATGVHGRDVTAAQCLLRTVGHAGVAAPGVYDGSTRQAVQRFQHSRRLAVTGTVDRRTWTALLSAGPRPVLKRGSAGPAVRRLQRSLNAAFPRGVRVDGGFDWRTADAVRRYQALIGQRPTGIVTETTWRALARGTLGTEHRPGKEHRPGTRRPVKERPVRR